MSWTIKAPLRAGDIGLASIKSGLKDLKEKVKESHHRYVLSCRETGKSKHSETRILDKPHGRGNFQITAYLAQCHIHL